MTCPRQWFDIEQTREQFQASIALAQPANPITPRENPVTHPMY